MYEEMANANARVKQAQFDETLTGLIKRVNSVSDVALSILEKTSKLNLPTPEKLEGGYPEVEIADNSVIGRLKDVESKIAIIERGLHKANSYLIDFNG